MPDSDYKKNIIPIKYTSREFSSIKRDLLDHAQRYYSNSYKDFSENSFGSLMVDTVAYVGDILSYYLDYNVNESFLDSATEFNNILRHARTLGYKFKGISTSYGVASLYVVVPAVSTGMGPARNYLPIIRRGSRFKSSSGASFILTENVDFNDNRHQVVVADTDPNTGAPTSWAIKANGRIMSGRMGSESISVGGFQRFRRVDLASSKVSEIISVFDSDGNEYYEVEYLSQNVVYKEVVNKNALDDEIPSILKPFAVPRRFVVERTTGLTSLVFGYASETELSSPSIPEPENIVLDVYGKDYTTDLAFDPSKMVSTDKFGIGPSNTTLTINYRASEALNSNAAVGSVNKVANATIIFKDPETLVPNTMAAVKRSLEIYNEEPISGTGTPETQVEIKRRVIDNFATQNRAVTKEDYEAMTYAMPNRFGVIKRCSVVRENDSIKRNLNMFIISENSKRKLTTANATLKNNLKRWINRNKMINDTVDILDAKIVNLQIKYTALSTPDVDRFSLQARANRMLINYFNSSKMYIGESFYLSNIYNLLNNMPGIIDVENVEIVNITDVGYSDISFDVPTNTSANGRYVIAPKNVIFEIKFPALDIKGTIK
tara:strand:- start:1451 stop:3262 length:1812 start_codon:yes stop_codon:yes gene_type:complete